MCAEVLAKLKTICKKKTLSKSWFEIHHIGHNAIVGRLNEKSWYYMKRPCFGSSFNLENLICT